MIAVNDRIGCVTVLEVLEATQARERGLLGYRGKPVHPKANGSHVWVRCACLLEFLVRARKLAKRQNDVRCGNRCELGKEEAERPSRLDRWEKCRNIMCGKKLRSDNRTGFCKDCQQGHNPGGRRWFHLSNPKVRERHQEAMKALRSAKALRGECTWCPAPSPDSALCPKCRAKEMESRRACRTTRMARAAAWRAKHVAAGLCVSCANPAAPGKRRCERHGAADRNQKLAAYHARKANEARRAAA